MANALKIMANGQTELNSLITNILKPIYLKIIYKILF